MHRLARAPFIRIPGLLAALLLAVGCSDLSSPDADRSPLETPLFSHTGSGIALDQRNGTVGNAPGGTTVIAKGFNPTNPHLGSTVLATIFWLGTSTITDVTDHLTDGTPVGNSYRLVQHVTAGGLSMATYATTNAQNFPDPHPVDASGGPDQNKVLVVRVTFSAPVFEGGILISAFSGVAPVFADALGEARSNSGSGNSTTVASPGAVAVAANGLVYAVTMSNGVVGLGHPPGFSNILEMADNVIKTDGEYLVQASAGSVNPQWTWFFNTQACPTTCTWLATALALNPPAAEPPPPPPPPPPPAATQLAFSVQPSQTTAGDPIAPAVQVSALDDAGNLVSSYTGPITVAIGSNPSGGTLSGTRTVSAVDGVATFGDLSIDKPGSGYTLQATATDVTSATSIAFDVAAEAIVPTRLVFVVHPSNTTAGNTISPAVQVAVQDDAGNVASDWSGTITVALAANPAGGTLLGTKTVSVVNGVGRFSDLRLQKAGAGYTLRATASGLASATSLAFDISAGSASRLFFTVQPSRTQPNTAISPAVQVTARDAYGNRATSFNGSVSMAIGRNGSLLFPGTLSGTKTVAAVNGVATFSNLKIDKSGDGYTLVASAPGVAGAESAPFTVAALVCALGICL